VKSQAFNRSQLLIVGLQHLVAMFGATILVPMLTGFPVSITLFASGAGTLIFHAVTDHKVPAYLGSSFAFIAPLSLVLAEYGGVSSALGGIIAAGLVYVLFSYLFKHIGSEKILKLFPSVVVGPVIMVIGLGLAPVAIDQIGASLSGVFVALFTLLIAMLTVLMFKGFLRIIPVITAVIGGYLLAAILGMVNFAEIAQASLIGLPSFTLPVFNPNAIIIIAPVALVAIVEHIGDVLAISEEVHGSRKLAESPGFEKTLLGDGLATLFAGFVGGVPNTTYGENIGVMSLTEVYKPLVMKVAAIAAIIISFSPKFEALIHSIPEPVIGGISVLLFGMIANVGLKTLLRSDANLNDSRNLIIVSVILVLGLGGAVINIGAVEISSMALAAIAGIVLNQLLHLNQAKDSDGA